MTTINQAFDLLDKWRHLPAYQLERRADIFFALYLPDIFRHCLATEIGGVIPEFPLRLGTLYPAKEPNKQVRNRSVKADYLVKAKDEKVVYLVELKTEMASRRQKQDNYLLRAKAIGLAKILNGLQEIYANSKQKRKYQFLLAELDKLGLISWSSDRQLFELSDVDCTLEIVYIQPRKLEGEPFVISFDEVVEAVSRPGAPLGHRFAQSLRQWVIDQS